MPQISWNSATETKNILLVKDESNLELYLKIHFVLRSEHATSRL